MNIIDYIKYYKDIPFSESSFNDLDALLLASLSYLDLKEILPTSLAKTSLENAYNEYRSFADKIEKKEIYFIKSVKEIFNLMASGKRYSQSILYNYKHIIDDKTQFGALSIKLPNGIIYISFEGTDNSLIGWKEDFSLSYDFPTSSQKKAINYVNTSISRWNSKEIIFGGHSKGGNLAMSAAMKCNNSIKRKIKNVYNFDGPGFRKIEYNSESFNKIKNKIKLFVPTESIVGMLLLNPTDYIVIKSNTRGIWQHELTSWMCYGQFFIKGELSQKSKSFENRIKSFLLNHDYNQREILVNTFFDILEKCDIKTTNELLRLQLPKIMALIKEVQNIDEESKKILIDCLKDLIIWKERPIENK
ncbi:MAG: Mbeg1-like protein [Bacilli bacterium]